MGEGGSLDQRGSCRHTKKWEIMDISWREDLLTGWIWDVRKRGVTRRFKVSAVSTWKDRGLLWSWRRLGGGSQRVKIQAGLWTFGLTCLLDIYVEMLSRLDTWIWSSTQTQHFEVQCWVLLPPFNSPSGFKSHLYAWWAHDLCSHPGPHVRGLCLVRGLQFSVLLSSTWDSY